MQLPAREKPAASPRQVRVRMTRPSLLLAGALVLVAAAWVGAANPGGYVWVGRLLHHPFLFGLAVSALLIAAIVGRIRTSGTRTVVSIVAGTLSVAALTGLMVVLDLVSLGLDEVGQISAPDDAPYTAVVSQGTNLIDPVWVVSIRQSRGVLSREWRVGCLNSDAAEDGYQDMTWVSPSQLSIRTVDGRRLSVQIDTNSGQPKNHIDTGAGC